VRSTCIEAVRSALTTAVPALLEWHTGRCGLAANRDLLLNDRHWIGFNPEVPADDTLLVGRVVRMDGHPLATIVNYACHPTTLAWENTLISPDFLGAMRETIELHTGDAPAIFLQGASGDLAPRQQYVGDPAVADRHGRQLGFSVLATLSDMNPPAHQLAWDSCVESGAPLAIWKTTPRKPPLTIISKILAVEVPLNKWPTAAEMEEQLPLCKDRASAERIRRKLRIRNSIGDGSTHAVPLHVCRLGDTLICGTMMEAYSAMQEQLRRLFPNHTVVWMNLLNGSLGYLVPSRFYANDQYTVWQTPVGSGGFECVFAAARDAISELINHE